MSTTAVAQDTDPVHIHKHHVSSVPLLAVILVVLLVLTVLTVAVSRVDLGGSLNLIIAMGIAFLKAGLVVTFFMHLLHDKPFNAVLLFYTLLTVATFFLFTLIDLSSRGAIDPIRNVLLEVPPMAGEAAANAEEHELVEDHTESPAAESH